MSDTSRKSRRLGPFQLGRRCKHAAVELGPIHEARNVQTGAPALVLTPGPRPVGRPKRDWRVRVHVQATPPSVALEVEQAPAEGRLPELTNMLLLLLAGIDAVGHSARVRRHLTSPRVERPTPLPVMTGLAVVSMLVLAVAGGFWWGSASRPGEPESLSPGVALSTTEGAPSSILTDGGEPEPAAVAYPLPDKPFSDQAKAPCNPRRKDEIAINGGCWVTLERRPPCDEESQAEYQGKCYLPVHAKAPVPRSVTP